MGGMFEYVSGANFFGEAVEWLGYAIVADSLPAWGFFITTCVNTGARAMAHHNDYVNVKFKGTYPPSRKAFIPFIL